MACIICVLGIPATGKTQFCWQLTTLLKKEFCDSTVLTVSYDSLIPAEVEELLINASISDLSQKLPEWKNRRRRIVDAVGDLLSEFFDKRESIAAASADKLMEETRVNILALNKIEKCLKTQKNLFVVIDDNLYYRSMRYEYFQVARTYECGFCQIYLNCDISVALQRNKARLKPVSEDIIKTMADKLEDPLPVKNQWEKYSSLICTSNEITDSDLSKATELIRVAIEHPFQQVDEIDGEMKQIARRISSTNIIHQADNFLRKAAGQLIKELNSKSVNHFNEVHAARLSVLKEVKSGCLILPPELTSLVESGQLVDQTNSVKLKEFLLEKLKEKLSKC